jgi:hypothetical protein
MYFCIHKSLYVCSHSIIIHSILLLHIWHKKLLNDVVHLCMYVCIQYSILLHLWWYETNMMQNFSYIIYCNCYSVIVLLCILFLSYKAKQKRLSIVYVFCPHAFIVEAEFYLFITLYTLYIMKFLVAVLHSAQYTAQNFFWWLLYIIWRRHIYIYTGCAVTPCSKLIFSQIISIILLFHNSKPWKWFLLIG